MSLARAFAALTGASVVTMAVQVVRGKLAAVVLGAAGVGVFNQLALMWNVGQIVGTLGAGNGIIHDASRSMAQEDDARLRDLVSTATLLLGGVSCGLALLGAVFAADLSRLLLDDGGRHASLVVLMLLSVPLGVGAQIYRSLLSAARAVGELVRNQIWSDLVSAAIFAGLIYPLGVRGAAIGFMSTQLILLALAARSVRRTLGPGYLRPSPDRLRWRIVRENMGFGLNSVITTGLANLAVIAVSRIIIAQLGLEASGIFSNAWRIAYVYLGAVTTVAISYLLPTLARADHAAELSRETNATARFYLMILPPVMVGIMAGGEIVVHLILSREFAPAAVLLLLLVPAELFRIMMETIGIALLARGRASAFSAVYAVQTTVFVIGALGSVPHFGLMGAAVAYAGSQIMAAGVASVIADANKVVKIERTTGWALFYAVGLLAAGGLTTFLLPFGVLRIGLCLAAIVLWLISSYRNPPTRALIRQLQNQLARRSGTSEPR